MSILSYFKPAVNDSLYGEALHSTGPVTGTQVCVARELNGLIEEENTKTSRQIVPVKIKKLHFAQSTLYLLLANGRKSNSRITSLSEEQ